ncbi:zinc-binding metallopeptidase family protein [Gordonia sp. NPDC003504]
MRDFLCRRCGQRLTFENSLCLHCGSALGFWPAAGTMVLLDGSGHAVIAGTSVRRCANSVRAQCNWLVPKDQRSALCASCRLTRTRPRDEDVRAVAVFGQVETAKRRVIWELSELGLPIVARADDPRSGLAFDLLSSRDVSVITGHCAGVITLDLAEGYPVHRERQRVELAERYRTVIGHFRHELGHYYQMVLVDEAPDPARAAEFRRLFGDPDADYDAALRRHHSRGAPRDWSASHVSGYATMHPREDFAETFAHYLHIRDTLDTAARFAMAPSEAALDETPADVADFDRLIACWLPTIWAFNQINRSMGHSGLYPFVLAEPVVEKMRFVHDLTLSERVAEHARTA